MKKKLIAIGASIMVASGILTGCSKSDNSSNSSKSSRQQSSQILTSSSQSGTASLQNSSASSSSIVTSPSNSASTPQNPNQEQNVLNLPALSAQYYDNSSYSDYYTENNSAIPGQWQNYGIGDPFVMRWNGVYYMYGTGWKDESESSSIICAPAFI